MHNDSETLSSIARKILELIPNSLKEETSLAVFKNKIKTQTTNVSRNI